jgi:serine/threonine protein kinase/tetratricopeptide (TPR) repeat protein
MRDVPVPDPPAERKRGGVLRALRQWLTGAPPAGAAPPSPDGSAAALPTRIGPYAIERKLGQGGMGVVYAARDERLHRTVALKTMSAVSRDETARKRFWREARAAASVNHPNICQIYEIGEDRGELFIAMELLEGEALADRLPRGPLSVSQTLPIGLGMLAALSTLHGRGIVHRDLKPSNVFLTPHGVKLLDFGVARLDLERSAGAATELTPTGMVIGTPAYMAPELVSGEAEARSDLFAVGAILFEMLSGRRAFEGRTPMEILHGALYEHPPALVGSPAGAAVDRVIRRALAKRAADRPGSADAMADELRAVRGADGDDTAAMARALTRLVVLPFRVLRPDPESDFLAFSLADAIATSLAGIDSLVVRSSAVAARFAGDAPDLQALATEADVDRVVVGTVVRSGDQVRAAAQLVEAPGGTLLTSLTVQASLGDLFRLQDDMARRVADALALPLAGRGAGPTTVVTPNARAYELYLRANELARTYDGIARARALYQECVDLDPGFAPAWAHLGRCHLVIGRYVEESPDSEARAEAALRRALDLAPRLSVAHKFFANLEAGIGQAPRALVRLVAEAQRHGNDPELFAGLVHAGRYCGLYEESIAAHAEARRLDPNVPTSVEQTLLMAEALDRLLAVEQPLLVPGAEDGIRIMGLGLAGRRDEARHLLGGLGRGSLLPAFRAWTQYLAAWLDRRPADMVVHLSDLSPLKIQDDPEAIFLEGWLLCDAGEHQSGLDHLRRAVAKGYYAAPTLSASRHFDPLRGDPAFQAVVSAAEAGRRDALAAFRDAGGEGLLGR